jgi:hypothetical protein
MGFFRLRRTIHIGPGLRINLSESGVSTSVGHRGASFTVGPRGTRTTVGVLGTDLRYMQQTPTTPVRQGRAATPGLVVAFAIVGLLLAVVALFV